MTTKADRDEVMDFFPPHPAGIMGQWWHKQETGDYLVAIWVQITIANFF